MIPPTPPKKKTGISLGSNFSTKYEMRQPIFVFVTYLLFLGHGSSNVHHLICLL